MSNTVFYDARDGGGFPIPTDLDGLSEMVEDSGDQFFEAVGRLIVDADAVGRFTDLNGRDLRVTVFNPPGLERQLGALYPTSERGPRTGTDIVNQERIAAVRKMLESLDAPYDGLDGDTTERLFSLMGVDF